MRTRCLVFNEIGQIMLNIQVGENDITKIHIPF